MAISCFRLSEIATAYGLAMTRKFGGRPPQSHPAANRTSSMAASPYSNPIGEADPFIVNFQLSIVN